MAEFLIYKGPHWMDALTQARIDRYQARNEHFLDKYNARYQRGDIVEIREDGFWANRGWGTHAFYLVKIPGLSKTVAEKYMESWNRDVTITKVTNDTINHIYAYNIAVDRTSLSGAELFTARDFLVSHLPAWISVPTKTAESVTIQAEPLKAPKCKENPTEAEIADGWRTPAELIQRFEQEGKDALSDFRKMIRRRKYHVLADDLPQALKDKLQNNEFIEITQAQAQDYLEDKGLI